MKIWVKGRYAALERRRDSERERYEGSTTLGPPCHDAQVYREPHDGWVYSQPNSTAKLPPFDTCTRRSDRGDINKNAITGALLSQTTSVKENRVSGRHEMVMGRSFESGGFLSGYESSISLTQTCMTCGRKRGLYCQATRTRKSNPHSTQAALTRPRPSSWASGCLGAVPNQDVFHLGFPRCDLKVALSQRETVIGRPESCRVARNFTMPSWSGPGGWRPSKNRFCRVGKTSVVPPPTSSCRAGAIRSANFSDK